MLKKIIRVSIAAGCGAAGMTARAERGNRSSLTILCYHRVLPADLRARYFLPHLAVTPACFARQCAYLARNFEVLTLSDALAKWTEGAPRARPLAALTFDDGYGDNAAYASPVLHSASIPATFFVLAGLVGTGRMPWYDRLGRAASLLSRSGRLEGAIAECNVEGSRASVHGVVEACKRVAPTRRKEIVDFFCAEAGIDDDVTAVDAIMTRDDLVRLVETGHEIGSHSSTHEILPLLDDEALRAEIFESKRTLETITGRVVNAFCYPNGDYDDRARAMVGEAGYTSAVTVHSGANEPGRDRYLLRRRFVDEERLSWPGGRFSEALFRMELSGLTERLRSGSAGAGSAP